MRRGPCPWSRRRGEEAPVMLTWQPLGRLIALAMLQLLRLLLISAVCRFSNLWSTVVRHVNWKNCYLWCLSCKLENSATASHICNRNPLHDTRSAVLLTSAVRISHKPSRLFVGVLRDHSVHRTPLAAVRHPCWCVRWSLAALFSL